MTRPRHTRRALPACLLVLVVLLAFANIITSGKVWEDDETVFQNPFMFGPSRIPYLFTNEYWIKQDIAHGGAYRPIVQSSFALEYALWHGDPRGYHFTNILLHALSVLAVYAFLKRITGSAGPALLAALLFAVHPTRSEAVGWLKNRAELMCAGLMLLAMLAFMRSAAARSTRAWPLGQRRPLRSSLQTTAPRARAWPLVCGVAFLVLALLCKGMAIVLPILLVLYVLCFCPRERWTGALAATAPFWLVVLGYAAFKVFVLSGSVPKQDTPLHISMLDRVQIPGWTAFFYERLLLFPFNLCVDRDFFRPTALPGVNAFVSAAALVLAALPFAFLLSKRRGPRAALFFLCFFLAALLPYVNVLYIEVRPLADQRLYLPALALCGLAALWIAARRKHRRARAALVVAACLAMAALAVQRNFVWSGMYPLFHDAAYGAPGMARVHSNLGAAYHEFNRYATAKRHLERSVLLDEHPKATRLLGLTLAQLGEHEAAIAMLKRAFNLRKEPITCKAIAGIYATMGRYDDAKRWYERAIEMHPYNPDAYYALALCQSGMRDPAGARASLETAVSQDPTLQAAWAQLGNIYLDTRRFQDAARCYAKAAKLDPRDAGTRLNMGIALLQLGNDGEAEQALRAALAIDPGLVAAHVNLAQLYRRRQDWPRAAGHLSMALRIDPTQASYWALFAETLDRLNKLGPALAAYSRACQLAPGAWPIAQAAGDMAKRRGRLREAVRFYALALKANPDCHAAATALDDIAGRLSSPSLKND